MDAAMEQQTYWTAKQNLALSMVKAGHNVYIGGQAGCGKSTLVTHIMQWAENERKSVALTCTTGVACSNFSPVC
ncbi:hypothetical protein DPMN_038545 [Dreissena polymorpha]|uniref:ATP-dependent DNA helicase n=1 Tax=Dreissena polymorpha TaxID=45954 RepID=A0A9D4RQU4_DREPO|nr:hypothetical protein DPMN_078925 [Dreissena polymorpha]KAH3716300.1 hypothetical protein DPMN_059019 [Dreissena polymorpha]KAH3834730.1 hypothetical protein DPMN_108065 [Dreissena polymorpha]KAH3875282.1 hypothetical protein DPMN_038545 [Dreissena polymorpha]